MTDKIDEIDLEETHYLSTEEKLKYFGYGEWVEEPDLVLFKYKGYMCEVFRVITPDGPTREHMFGGHLCGYVYLPQGHKLYGKHYRDIDIECHGGLTYSKEDKNGYKVGFDCGHCFDIIPSYEVYKKHIRKENSTINDAIQCLEKSLEKFSKSLEFMRKTYKNVNYCIAECKSIIDQFK